MKKIIFISFLLLFTALPLWIVLDKEQEGNEMMTGGFGTQYADSPYPFGNPSAPVRCRINTFKLDYVNLKVQQRQTTLKIPADAVKEVHRRADAEKCDPIDIKLVYVFYDNKLLRQAKERTALGISEARQAGYVGTEETWTLVEIKIVDLLSSSVDAKVAAETIKSQTDLKRYTPQLKMQHYPLWFYPNARYVQQERNGNWDLTYKYGHGVVNSNNPLTNQPYIVECRTDVDLKREDPDNDESRQKYMQAKIADGGYGYCEGLYYVVTDDTVLTLEVKTSGDAVPFIDQIYPQIDNTIRDYIVPTSSETLKTIN